VSFVEVDDIVKWFRPLSPVGKDMWKLDDENEPPIEARSSLLLLCYGPKRYALFFDMPAGSVHIAKASAHGLTVRPPQGA
jgi:hypothetical protein